MASIEEQFKAFISGCGYNYGYGYGYGNGYGGGNGDGSGYGYGGGNGSGYGDGDGDGGSYGDGSYGDGDGSGGYDDGYGDGYGDGDGYGGGNGGYDYDYGDGSGDGDGDGDGSGYDYGNGIHCGTVIIKMGGRKVFYPDGLPFIPQSVSRHIAHGLAIKNDLTTKKCVIVKFKNCIAHGDSIRSAMEDAMRKYFSQFDFKETKAMLLNAFKKNGGKLSVKELYKWHGLLTGSCRFGRDEFQREHNLKNDDVLTLKEFVQLTKDSFGGDKIKELTNE